VWPSDTLGEEVGVHRTLILDVRMVEDVVKIQASRVSSNVPATWAGTLVVLGPCSISAPISASKTLSRLLHSQYAFRGKGVMLGVRHLEP
jgi:hypothetical protein